MRVPEKYRIRRGPRGSDASFGNNGAFYIPGPCGKDLSVVASDGEGWQHVSVSTPNRCPNWPEMCFIKGLFWGDDETVIQYHPPRSAYVNYHPHCLHMWKPDGIEIPLPPSLLVGPRDAAELAQCLQALGIHVIKR